MKEKEPTRPRFAGYATLNVLLPVQLKEKLRRRAAQLGVPVSKLVREALERYLEEEK